MPLCYNKSCRERVKPLWLSEKSIWEHSSAGRASALQAEGHRFESYCSHHTARQFSWLERQPVTLEVRGSSPLRVANFRGDFNSGKITPLRFASVAQLVEQGTENPRVVGSIPIGGTICGFSSFGRARPCQGRGGGFEPRNPLHRISTPSEYWCADFFKALNVKFYMAPQPSGKAEVCKTFIPRSDSGWCLQVNKPSNVNH